MVRATEPQKDEHRQVQPENTACKNHDMKTEYVGISDDEFEALMKEGIEKYDHIWRSLADK